MYITLLSYVFYTIPIYTVSLIYLERGLYLENKLLSNYCQLSSQGGAEEEGEKEIGWIRVYQRDPYAIMFTMNMNIN